MLKRFASLYYIALSALLMLTACQSDEATEQGGGQQSGNGKIGVHLRMGVAGSQATRAWEDGTNAVTAEMMNVWTVVVVNDAAADVNYNKVVSIYACKPSDEPDQEIDDYVELPAAGTYRFYSFANMSPKVVMSLLGITAPSGVRTRADGGTVYDDGSTSTQGNERNATGTVTSYGSNTDFYSNQNYVANTYYPIEFSNGATVNADYANSKTVNMAGNNFDVSVDNGYGAMGIPMSNVQTIEVTSSTETIDLIVIRMMAKIELQVYNDRGSDVTIESFTLTDVTANADGNLKLLPNLSDEGHGSMEVTTHGDIRPNLGSATPKDLTLYPSSEQGTVSATVNNTSGTPVSFTFYVNESSTPDNGFGQFFLKIKLTGEAEERYALIDNTNAVGQTGSWNYIARNDYRVIPIVLDDYKFDIIPYDFPAIGVYPASVKEEDGLYTINFHDYGHFHLLPVVKKLSDNSIVPFTATTPTGTYGSTSWGFIGDDFGDSWKSWTDATKATEYDNSTASPAFYRTGTDSYITTTTDGDEVGGEPIWYANTSSPQWDPDGGTNYRPFIFGYIADPGSALSEDKMVYHEFTINLYKQGMSAPRQMTYRLLMILDADQMLYGSRRLGNAPSRHTHGF